MPQSFADQLRSIPMSPNLGQSLERAHRSARDQSHRLVTLEHLLLALTEDAEAALILQSANLDLGRLSTDVSGYLGRLLEDMRAEPGAEPRPDPELLRVLQAAASAAQQSRRKQIDGAIVLAAIVGDGKSPAAGLLKALGMTFEEAIRALQRANTKARLKPLAKPSAGAPAAETPTVAARVDSEPAPVEAAPASPADTPGAEEPPTVAQPLVAQSADEILAAARARIQQRAAAKLAKTEPSAARAVPPAAPKEAVTPRPAAMDVDAAMEPVDPAQTKSLTAAIEAAMTPAGSRGAGPALPFTVPSLAAPTPGADGPADKTLPTPAAPPPPTTIPARPAWTPPPPEPRRQPAARAAPPPTLARLPLPPFPVRPVEPGEGPLRPPLPPRPAANGHAQPGAPSRPARVPWPETGEPGAAGRPPLANGSLADTTAVAGVRPLPPRLGPAPRGGQGERALMAESVPRRMRIGVPATAEVRVARDKMDGLIVALNSRGPAQQSDGSVARVLSVRLAAPEGRFWIEPTSPEAHWVDNSPAAHRDDPVVWRWTVVPRRRGRNRLTLRVSVQNVSRDGIALQPAATERTVEVMVRPKTLRRFARLAGWAAAVAAGAFIGSRGQEHWAPVLAAFRRALALLGV
jgi:hypothetical protein